MSLSYRINLEPDDNGSLLVTCPALPEVTTFGDDESDAMKRARGAIEEAIAARMSEGQDIPDGDARGRISRTAAGARRPQSGAVSAGAP
jgi:predicted RNase H-like HicB family nuclease